MEALNERVLASYSWACHYANSCTAAFPSSYDREELKSVGILGYIVAANRYDETKGGSFRGFCATRIRGAIMDELRRTTWQSRSARRTHRMISQTGSSLEAELQRRPTGAEMALALGIDESELAQMQRLSQPAICLSLDDESLFGATEDESISLKEVIADESVTTPADAYDMAEMRRALIASIGALSPTDASVIVLHYLRNIPFLEIARMMKVTPSRVSQLHHRALDSLRSILQRDGARS